MTRYKKKTEIEFSGGVSAHELSRQMKEFNADMKRYCLFLYNLMSNKMDFSKDPTELEIKHIVEIKEALRL